MPHVVLLGDSVLDNGAYTDGGPDVIAQVRKQLPKGWRGSLLAVDGSTTEDIPAQLSAFPPDATHCFLSVGGNDAILRAEVLDARVQSSGEALLLLAEVGREFEEKYRKAVEACLSLSLPLVVLTIYHGNFPDPRYQRVVATALTVFNDVIIRTATEMRLMLIDTRFVCNSPADFANPIEPSSVGGEKIARAIARAATEPTHSGRGAYVVTH
jgi:GDSL-like Lipase/Acylhydrolase family